MKKPGIDVVLGMILPWISVILFTIANTWYVDNFMHRAGLQVLIIWNAVIMLRLARKCRKK